MPRQKPGLSRQDYETPPELMAAVERMWGKPDIDLAASEGNKKADKYFSLPQDSLKQNWLGWGLCWLNPPFGHIAPWAKKCAESGAHVLLLVPASVGSEWFAKWVYGKARTWALRGRITFVGEDHPYPKDCMICEYSVGKNHFYDFQVWDWRKQ